MDELVVIDNHRDLEVRRDPVDVLEEARRAAKALKDVIDAKPKPVIFGGEKYLEFEDWQTVGRFYGITPRIVSTAPVQFGSVEGWEAKAEAYHVPTGRVVASAEAMCLNDESNWNTRPVSAWHYVKKSGGTSEEDPGKDELIWEASKDGKRRPKKVRVETTQPVPRFQLRSMAQTRAGAKALRNALAWVVVLAGYRPTPAEEMTLEREHKKEPEEDYQVVPPGDTHDVKPSVAQPAAPATVDSGSEPTGGSSSNPDRDAEERSILLSKIKTAFDKKNILAERRKKVWLEYAKGATPDTVDLAVLHEILKFAMAL